MQLIDATRICAKMRKSLGSKRVYMTDEQIAEIVKVYADNGDRGDLRVLSSRSRSKATAVLRQRLRPREAPRIVSKVFDSKFFGYRKVTVDRPPQAGKPVKVKLKKGQKPYDPELRDTENVPLTEDIGAYLKREVLPHVPDAFVTRGRQDEKDGQTGKVGYEINFNRYFYVYKPPRKPQVIASGDSARWRSGFWS